MQNPSQKSLYYVIAYTIIISLAAALIFALLVANIPEYETGDVTPGDPTTKHIFFMTVAVMLAARALGANRAKLLKYATSGDVTGDYHSVVGYAAAVLYA